MSIYLASYFYDQLLWFENHCKYVTIYLLKQYYQNIKRKNWTFYKFIYNHQGLKGPFVKINNQNSRNLALTYRIEGITGTVTYSDE